MKRISLAYLGALCGCFFSTVVLAETFPSTSNNAAAPTDSAAASTASATSVAQSPQQAETVQNNNGYKGNRSKIPPQPEIQTSSWRDNLSGDLNLTTNYVFRGVSQTQDSPALQAGLTYQLPKGFYVNAWGSNVKQVNNIDTSVEIDAMVGWAGHLNEDFSYNFDLDRYSYSAHQLSYNEFNSVFHYDWFQFGYSYSPNVYGTTGIGRYYLFGLNYDVPPYYSFTLEDVSLHVTAGHYTLPKAAGNSYNDYSIWLTKKFKKHYSLTAQWTDTNGRQKTINYDDPHLLLMLGVDFN